ncbi:M48 family metallopeptidase [Marinobacter sp. SS21]|uniref:M48 family metallopeptidase n=1 Tax=Marinobacter sp. SS21 TaxID=2979460 RepID=UPI0023314AC6|nr:M48 family metallopeptidase [Marinobacter sp. SS21]MDC0662084.1 M48 family metallopeptidase [Marinobacter sp. SS21]
MSQSINGVYYDGKSSRRNACRLYVTTAGQVQIDGIQHDAIAFQDIQVPARVGNSARTLILPDGGRFETSDNPGLDVLVSTHGRRRGGISLHLMERKLRVILPLLLLCVVMVYLAVTRGIPWASEQLAYRLSAEWSDALGASVLERLDAYYFSPTVLSKPVQEEYRQLLDSYLPAHTDFSYTLLFRHGDLIGANAFALPDGTIVVTDQLVKLADTPEEVLAVMLHEIGHVERRHSLRALLESSGVALLFMLLTGDAEFVQEWVVALPPLLLQAKFSRDHEWEADSYALERMSSQGIDPEHFASMMEKLVGQGGSESSPSEEEEEAQDPQPVPDWLNYLSTHPASELRIQRFRQASEALQGSTR